MARHRIEDFGRISEISSQIMRSELFSWKGRVRCKDAEAWFDSLPKESQLEIINVMAYQIDEVFQDLVGLWELARYGDDEDGED
jgi:hypothetical protein